MMVNSVILQNETLRSGRTETINSARHKFMHVFNTAQIHTQGAAAEENVEQSLAIAIVFEVLPTLLIQELGHSFEASSTLV